MTPVLSAIGLVRHFTGGDGSIIRVLDGADLAIAGGEFVAIIGASGSGKSTLLHLLGALDRPDGGEVFLEGQALSGLDAMALSELRNRRVGFVFQFHHLLRDFTARENVMMPLLIGGMPADLAGSQAAAALASVDLSHRLDARVTVLSGGEQQRVALARALVTNPAVLLADEPTGNLDPSTAGHLHDVLAGRAREQGVSVIVVTHSRALAARADRVLALEDGRLRPAEAMEVLA